MQCDYSTEEMTIEEEEEQEQEEMYGTLLVVSHYVNKVLREDRVYHGWLTADEVSRLAMYEGECQWNREREIAAGITFWEDIFSYTMLRGMVVDCGGRQYPAVCESVFPRPDGMFTQWDCASPIQIDHCVQLISDDDIVDDGDLPCPRYAVQRGDKLM